MPKSITARNHIGLDVSFTPLKHYQASGIMDGEVIVMDLWTLESGNYVARKTLQTNSGEHHEVITTKKRNLLVNAYGLFGHSDIARDLYKKVGIPTTHYAN